MGNIHIVGRRANIFLYYHKNALANTFQKCKLTSFFPVKIYTDGCKLAPVFTEDYCATYIDGNEMNLSMTVLSSLGGGHIDDLARTVYGKKQRKS